MIKNREYIKFQKPYYAKYTDVYSNYISQTRNMISSSAVAISIIMLHKFLSLNLYQLIISKFAYYILLIYSLIIGLLSNNYLYSYMYQIKNNYQNNVPIIYKNVFDNWLYIIILTYFYIFAIFLILLTMIILDLNLIL
jgi:hypothetical protein